MVICHHGFPVIVPSCLLISESFSCFSLGPKCFLIAIIRQCVNFLWSLLLHKNENLQVFLVHIYLHGWCIFQLQKMSKVHWHEVTWTWIQSWIFLLHMANHLFCCTWSTNILVHFVGWFFHTLHTLAIQWVPNYHINMISSNVLSLGSFFSQVRPLDTLWGQLYYTLPP